MKQALSPFPGAKETRVLSILGTVRPYSDIGEFNVVRWPFRFKKAFQDFSSSRFKTKVNINREELVMDGDSFASFVEEVKE
jgi:hypothetical protein